MRVVALRERGRGVADLDDARVGAVGIGLAAVLAPEALGRRVELPPARRATQPHEPCRHRHGIHDVARGHTAKAIASVAA